MNDRGSALVTALVLVVVFAAITCTCLYMASQADNQTLMEQVEQSISGAFGGAW